MVDWVGVLVVLVVVVGLGCFLAGWVQHEHHARACREQERWASELPSVGQPQPPVAGSAQRIPAGQQPTVVAVYLLAPAVLSRQEWPLVVDGDIVSELPPSDRGGAW